MSSTRQRQVKETNPNKRPRLASTAGNNSSLPLGMLPPSAPIFDLNSPPNSQALPTLIPLDIRSPENNLCQTTSKAKKRSDFINISRDLERQQEKRIKSQIIASIKRGQQELKTKIVDSIITNNNRSYYLEAYKFFSFNNSLSLIDDKNYVNKATKDRMLKMKNRKDDQLKPTQNKRIGKNIRNSMGILTMERQKNHNSSKIEKRHNEKKPSRYLIYINRNVFENWVNKHCETFAEQLNRETFENELLTELMSPPSEFALTMVAQKGVETINELANSSSSHSSLTTSSDIENNIQTPDNSISHSYTTSTTTFFSQTNHELPKNSRLSFSERATRKFG